MVRDSTHRITLAHNDNDRQGKVIAARRIIYQKDYQVNSAAVEAILHNQSWVPTMVWKILTSWCFFTYDLCRMPSQNVYHHMDLICLKCYSQILYMK
jgi:hypothetical protein